MMDIKKGFHRGVGGAHTVLGDLFGVCVCVVSNIRITCEIFFNHLYALEHFDLITSLNTIQLHRK